HIDLGEIEECRWLPSPDAFADVVERIDQRVDVGGAEAAAEIARRGGIGNALGADGVEEDLVLTAQFDVLDTGAAAQRVVREVENVIGLVIRQVNLEQAEPFVDGAGEADAMAQEVQRPDAAVSDAAATLGKFVMDVGGGEDGLVKILEIVFVEPILNSVLAGLQLT